MNIEELTAFCKQKGIVFQSSEIYGGMSGFWDYGPLGSELFNNLKAHWWRHFIHKKENMVGIDASIISHPRVWKASGHIDSFGDLLITCGKCKKKFRADHFIEEKLDINVEGMPTEEINKIIRDNKLKCPDCDNEFAELKDFNLLFATSVGAEEGKANTAYLRGETAQGMFYNFRLTADASRQKLPFGIAQIGKCFRNEISPRDFIFRCREFTIGEFEFFLHPDTKECDKITDKHLNTEMMFLSAEEQEKASNELKRTKIKDLLDAGKLEPWHAYWLAEQVMWLTEVGLTIENLKIREHTKNELSHYSSATFDLDYQFPFGSKELAGNANRGQYDLTQHIKEAKAKLELFDEETQTKVIPRVIEPTFGMDRVLLAVIVENLVFDKDRDYHILKLKRDLAPFKAAILPLMKKPELQAKAREVFESISEDMNCFYDASGSIGRRYARQDEIGTPVCITIDFDSLENDHVTIRDRDTQEQKRVKISELRSRIQ